MKAYGGNLTDYGRTNSLYLKNLEASYRRPKNQLELKDDVTSITSMSWNDIMSLVPDNWHDDSSDYWATATEEHFYCKDGQTNAYVKRGTDEEVEQIFDRQEASVLEWHIATDDNHVRFLAGGKIRAKGADWFVLKVIQQDSTGTNANKYNAMDTNKDNEDLRFLGLKTMVCVGGLTK